VEGVVCGLLDALDALGAHAPIDAVVLTGGGARSAAYRAVFADLCELPLGTSNADEAVAAGACVQAGAVALGVSHAEVIERWRLGNESPLAPSGAVGDALRGDIRQRYAVLRDTLHPGT
jgi:xylulokinase